MALTKVDDRGLKTPIDLLDNEKIRLGTGNDLEIHHDSNGSFIDDAGTGPLNIRTNNSNINIKGGGSFAHDLAIFKSTEGVELFYNNNKKFETTSSGVNVVGALTVNGSAINTDLLSDTTPQLGGDLDCNGKEILVDDNNAIKIGNGHDLRLFHDGTNSEIKNFTGTFFLFGDSVFIGSSAAGEPYFKGFADGAAELYHNSQKKLETTNAGVQISGGLNVTTTMHIPDGSIGLQVGNSNDLLIFHDGSNSYIKTTNTNTNLILEGAHGVDIKHGGENMAKFRPDAAVELYYDNTKKFDTSSDGAAVHGYLQIHSLPAVSYSDTREIALANTDLTRSNFYNHTNFESDSTILDSNGHFVAPIHGVYRLYVRISTDSDGGNRANIRLRKNGLTVNEAYAVNSSGMYQSVSSEIICELNQGQYLDVQVAQMHTMAGSQHKVVNFHMLG